ncbi:quinol:cytochrome C oxidoreductase [Catalinimonas niigatensis]|uniref:quinol:cytochrome C oxidoreductase n=1 Tax=Catalinimonas niigatensis TaxID=1397264 RepID=UPI0026653EFE|nr:quinol:cytochrome C oxidoreductase [Catalinimonas niigatensis]WPP51514.1 quinol:cytochrome C oxidoreductase [Catalinimonas niigatensis]
MTAENFNFNAGLKKKIAIVGIVGVVLLVLGIVFLIFGGGGHAAEGAHGAPAHGGGHSEFHWYDRLYSNLWINNVFFTGLSVIGLFFVALQYAAQAGWSVAIKRIPEAFGAWLPFAGVLMLAVFLVGGHTIFHWTHDYLYDESDPRYDAIIAGKQGYLNYPFYIIRMLVYFGVWYLMYRLIRRESLAEDINGGVVHYHKMVKYSTIFIVFFAITSSTSAWDWTLSIDTHWFSTMYGWYNFASWFVSGLAAITLVVVLLRENGYITIVSSEHLHDLGKFVFAFSIFWAYIWFSQFMLIYYANIPEESIYFLERLSDDYYAPFFFMNLIMNFFFPFLVLMTRDSKRHTVFLKLVCTVVLIGQWLNFYLMITPAVLRENGGLGFIELGTTMIYLAAFLFVVLGNLAKAPLVAKNHPMLQESIHHHT